MKDKKKIYSTIDGYFNVRNHIDKRRLVVAIYQRKDETLGVAKLYSEDDKVDKSSGLIIKDIKLSPSKHPSLNKETLVGNRVIYGRKDREGNFYRIMPNDLYDENDKLTGREYRKVKRKINADTKQHKKTKKATHKKWKRFFR